MICISLWETGEALWLLSEFSNYQYFKHRILTCNATTGVQPNLRRLSPSEFDLLMYDE